MDKQPVLHVVVIDFHHKKGCQVEYSYPPLIDGNPVESSELPVEWKHLPSLALPDGAHNYASDTVFFHLPSRETPIETIFGVSCYRQINADDLRKKAPDVTRSTVQKSVCVLSKLPLYGLIEAKLALITHAYFEERDFSQVELLEQTFNNLNQSIKESMLEDSQVFLGLSSRELILKFRHKALVLFKLLLLEKRVLFFGSPVKSLAGCLLSALSLHPGLLEKGLTHCVGISGDGNIHSQADAACGDLGATTVEHEAKVSTLPDVVADIDKPKDDAASYQQQQQPQQLTEPPDMVEDLERQRAEDNERPAVKSEFDPFEQDLSKKTDEQGGFISYITGSDASDGRSRLGSIKDKVAAIWSASMDETVEEEEEEVVEPLNVTLYEVGLPLPIFDEDCLCHPYLSLQYFDVLANPNVRSFVAGATNVLFKRKAGLYDALIDVNASTIEVYEPALRRALSLTSADLRFADHLVRSTTSDMGDIFLDLTCWEGGDEWVRLQFKEYMLQLLATADCGSEQQLEDFGLSFVEQWRETNSYNKWQRSPTKSLKPIPAGHPCHGSIGVSDVKLRLSHTIQSTERGRKLNAAVHQTGKAVAQTGKAFGGALHSARSAVTSWLSGWKEEEEANVDGGT